MAKPKTVYFCQNCGHESPKWVGKCPSCSEWNTFAEEIVQKGEGKNEWRQESKLQMASKPVLLHEIEASSTIRFQTHDNELNRVLGGGLVPGSLILIGGEPGIGKSTLMLQIGLMLGKIKTLYVSGEESEQQIKMRAERILQGKSNSANFFVLNETNTKQIFLHIEQLQPEL